MNQIVDSGNKDTELLTFFETDLRPFRGIGFALTSLFFVIIIVAGESICPVVPAAPAIARFFAGVF